MKTKQILARIIKKKKLDGFKNSNLVDSGEIVGHNIEEQIT